MLNVLFVEGIMLGILGNGIVVVVGRGGVRILNLGTGGTLLRRLGGGMK